MYWRAVEPGATKKFELDVTAETPGLYEGQPSRAYAYYEDEHVHWADPLRVTVEFAVPGAKGAEEERNAGWGLFGR